MTQNETKSLEPIKTHCSNCSEETNQDILFNDHELESREVIGIRILLDRSSSINQNI